MDIPKIINIKQLSDESKISYSRLYFRKNGYTKEEFELVDRTRIVNAIVNKLQPFFSNLGFKLILRPKGN